MIKATFFRKTLMYLTIQLIQLKESEVKKNAMRCVKKTNFLSQFKYYWTK